MPGHPAFLLQLARVLLWSCATAVTLGMLPPGAAQILGRVAQFEAETESLVRLSSQQPRVLPRGATEPTVGGDVLPEPLGELGNGDQSSGTEVLAEGRGSLRLACPESPSLLYSAAKAAGAAQVVNGTYPGLLQWLPEDNKYLVLYCDYGRLSNRLLCIRNHIILAGLLNRTLLVEPVTAQSEGYNLSIHFDLVHLRKCFGDAVALTTGEYSRRTGRSRIRVDMWACLATLFKVDKKTMKVRRSMCTDKFCRLWQDEGDSVFEAPLAKRRVCLSTMPGIIDFYGTALRNFQTIVLGDLTILGFLLPQEFTIPGDAPFMRHMQCPNALAMMPNAELVTSAQEYAKAQFGGAPYLAVHMRRGDFSSDRCRKFWTVACLPMEHAVSCILDEVSDMNLGSLVISTDAPPHEVLVMKNLLDGLSAPGLQIVFNPVLDEHLEHLIGLEGEGHATFQKVVLAQGTVFMGTDRSTFTADVQRMRHGMLRAHCRDSFICDKKPRRISRLDPFVWTML